MSIQATDELLHFVPGHLFHRMLWTLKTARITPHDSLPLALYHRIHPQIKWPAETYSMQWLFIIFPTVRAHLKGAGWDEYERDAKTVNQPGLWRRDGNAPWPGRLLCHRQCYGHRCWDERSKPQLH